MKRIFGTAVVLLCCAITLSAACATDALVDMVVFDDWESGPALGVAPTPRGTLVTGTSEFGLTGWMAYLDSTGRELWSFWEPDYEEQYLYPTALPDGRFAVLRVFVLDSITGNATKSLRILDRNGTILVDGRVSVYDRDMVAVGDSLFIVGNAEVGGDETTKPQSGPPTLSRYKTGWAEVRSKKIKHGYADFWPETVVYADRSLLVNAFAVAAGADAGVAVLMRLDLNGNVLWSHEFTPAEGIGSTVRDICATEDGMVAVACIEFSDEADDGRWCSVIGLNLDGEVLWKQSTGYNNVDYILPVEGGFLCVGRGLDTENCPNFGDGWVLLLDADGNVKAADATPDIGGGRVEVYGMVKDLSGQALLYGNLLEYPGSAGCAFVARLSFPQAYQDSPAAENQAVPGGVDWWFD